MLGKLMKYEWRGLRKSLLILLAVMAGITFLASIALLSLNPALDAVISDLSSMTALFAFLLYYLGLIACSLGTILVIAIRFYKTCYTDEGYLTHTLPVKTSQLVAAKTIVACLCQLVMMILLLSTAAFLVILAVVHLSSLTDYETLYTLNRIFNELNNVFKQELGASLQQFFLILSGVCVISSICSTIIILGCVSLGQIYTRHRVLGAIIAYFLSTIVLQIISYIGMVPFYSEIIKAEATGETLQFFSVFFPTLLPSIIGSIVIAIFMYFANIRMMSKSLNLE